MSLQPVELVIERACHFKAKPLQCRTCKANRKRGGKRAACEHCGSDAKPIQRQGCDSCGMAKSDPGHLGAPPSLNVLGSGDPMHFQTIKTQWMAALAVALEASGLPRGLGRVMVEGEATFPDRTRRDQGNFRVLIEKAFGDTLVNGAEGIPGGWLEDDDWTRYEFGNLGYRYEAGVSRTRLWIMPAPKAPVDGDALTLALPV